MNSLALATLSLALPAPVLASDVLVVDDNGSPGADFTQIQAAVDAAADGDIVLVRTGTYAGFQVLDKGVHVLADRDAFVFVDGRADVRDLATDSTVLIDGLILADDSIPGLANGGHLSVSKPDGTVWLEDLSVPATYSNSSGLFPTTTFQSSLHENLVVVGVDVTAPDPLTGGSSGGTRALRIRPSDGLTAIYDSSFASRRGTDPGPESNWGAEFDAAHLFVSNTTITAADGVPAQFDPVLGFCFSDGDGGDGVRLEPEFSSPSNSLGVYEFVATAVTPGASGGDGGTGCPADGVAGQAFAGPATPSFPVGSDVPRVLDVTSVVRPGEAGVIQLQGRPGELAVLGVSTTPGLFVEPAFTGLLALSGIGTPLPLGALDAAGELEFGFTSPLPAGLGLVVYVQAVTGGSDDGLVLSSPGTCLLLGSGF